MQRIYKIKATADRSAAMVSLSYRDQCGERPTALFSTYNPDVPTMSGGLGAIDGNAWPHGDADKSAALKDACRSAIATGDEITLIFGDRPEPVEQKEVTPKADEERKRKANEFDDTFNESGEGYNPYRDPDIS